MLQLRRKKTQTNKNPQIIVEIWNRVKNLLAFWILLCSACALVQEGLSSTGGISLYKFMHAQTLKTSTIESAT